MNYGPKIVTSGLVLALDAADKKSYAGSGTAWNDLSGRGNNGTLVNGPTFDTANGGSIVFDGTNDGCSITNLNGLNIQYPTHEIWFKLNNPIDGVLRQIFARTNVSVGTFNIRKGASNQFETNYRDSSNVLNSITITSIPSTNWTSIMITYDGTTARTYVNGVANSTSTGLSGPLNTGGTLAIAVGSQTAIASQFMNGNIAIARIYNRALSATEVLQNFNATRGRFGI